jgi:hypothetical protein
VLRRRAYLPRSATRGKGAAVGMPAEPFLPGFACSEIGALQLTLPRGPTMRHFPKCLALTAVRRDLSTWRT